MDPFDKHLEHDHAGPDHGCAECDGNAPHGSNTDEEMDVDADDPAGP